MRPPGCVLLKIVENLAVRQSSESVKFDKRDIIPFSPYVVHIFGSCVKPRELPNYDYFCGLTLLSLYLIYGVNRTHMHFLK